MWVLEPSMSNFMMILVMGISIMFLMNAQHLLKMLISLEALGLLFVSSILFSSPSIPALFLIFLVFTFLVCEAALGLGVLVQFSRSSGAELMKIYII